jgi:pilus assembly protein CpaC
VPGLTTVTLTAIDGTVETYEIVVELEIEYLKSILKRAVPTANVVPIPGANNTIILTGVVAHSEDIQIVLETAGALVGLGRVINAMRVGGVMQVQLCVVVARVNRAELRRMGFNLLQNNPGEIFGSTIANIIPPLAPVGIPSAQVQPTYLGSVLNSAPGAGNLFLGVFNTNDRGGLIAFLQALRDERLAKLLAEPRLVALSGRRASFVSGGQQAVPTVAGLGGTAGVEFVPFGTQVDFLPIVLGNGKIYLEVEPMISALDPTAGTAIPNTTGFIVPGRVVQSVRTAVELEDGQTFVIGGLIQNSVRAGTNKVPWAGDLPFVGFFFRAEFYEEFEEELVIMVTPHLVDGMTCDQLPKYLPGLETRSPDDCELFLEGILEAPRGPRRFCEDGMYKPAYKNSPSYGAGPSPDGPTCTFPTLPKKVPPGTPVGGHAWQGGCHGGACAGPGPMDHAPDHGPVHAAPGGFPQPVPVPAGQPWPSGAEPIPAPRPGTLPVNLGGSGGR